MMIKNTLKSRGPIVDAILHRRYLDDWMKQHPMQTKNLRGIVDEDVKWTIRVLNQIAAGRKAEL